MPGIGALNNDAAFIEAFQVMDGRIQNNEPTFVLSWTLSVLTVISAAALAWKNDRTIAVAAVIFLMGHVSTATQNVPRNNRIHGLDIQSADETTLSDLRQEMEGPWQRWNTFRTVMFGAVSLYYLFVLMRR